MFSTGAPVDVKQLEEEIRKEIEEKRKRLFSDEELEELQKLEMNIIPNPDRIRPYFQRELEFEKPEFKLPEYFDNQNYNIDLNTFLYSSHSRFGGLLSRIRKMLKPFFRLHGNMDAVIYKQAQFNREQVEFNALELERYGKLLDSLEKPFHYIRVLHTLINYVVAELTKLNLQHQMLKSQVEALAYDLDQLRKRERLLEKMVVLKEGS